MISDEIANQMARRLTEIKSSSRSQIQHAISTAITEKVLLSMKNKTGTSKVGAISKAQKAQSFLNMPRMYS